MSAALPPEQVRVVYSGMPDFGMQPPAPVADGPLSRPLVLGMIARLDAVKGHDLAIDAVARLHTRIPLRLVLAGPDHLPWAARMREQAAAAGLGSRVEFLGPRTDVAALLASFDLLLAPSRREGLSLTLIEAASQAGPWWPAGWGAMPRSSKTASPACCARPKMRRRWPPRSSGWPPTRRGAASSAWRHAKAYEARFTVDAMCAGTLGVYDAASIRGLHA